MCPSKGFNWFETSFRKYCILHLNPTKANQDLQFWMCVTIWISIYVSACPSFYTSISLYLARNLSVCRSVYSSWNVEILPAGATQTKQTPNIHQYTSVFRSRADPHCISPWKCLATISPLTSKKIRCFYLQPVPKKKVQRSLPFPDPSPSELTSFAETPADLELPLCESSCFGGLKPSFHDGTKERISAGGFEDFWSTKRGDGELWWSRSWSWLKYQ